MLVDSHCHLDFPQFSGDLDDVLRRAADAGVGRMVTIATGLATFDRALNLAESHDGVLCSVGVHPNNADDEPDVSAERLVALSHHPKVVGIGETGLDYVREGAPKELQEQSFRAHIRASRETGLPLIVHNRGADREVAAILAEEHAAGAFPCQMHCFSAGRDLAETALGLGFYISVTGIVTFKKSDELRDIIRDVPVDRLLVETDSPYLAPEPHRGKRNEPAFAAETAAFLAKLKGMDADDFARATTENFFRLFAKAA